MEKDSGMQDLVQAVQSIALAVATADDQPWSSIIPVITCATGAFGNVSCQGYYSQRGKTVIYNGVITITTVGTATGGIFLPLPVTAARANAGTLVGREFQVTGKGLMGTMDTIARCYLTFYDNTAAWASGHKIQFSVTYEAA